MAEVDNAKAKTEEPVRTEPENKFDTILEEIRALRLDLNAIRDRVAFIEAESGANGGDASHSQHQTQTQGLSDATTTVETPNSQSFNTDVGAEYAAIRAAVQSVRLPPELTLPADASSKQGIRKGDLPLCNSILRNARYCETALKVLQSSRSEKFEDLFTVLYAQIKYLQEEHAELIVQSTFDPTVSRFFRSLQRGSAFTPEALENLRSAASIAAVYKPPQPSRGRGGHFGRNDHRRPDLFSQQASRGFPASRGSYRQNNDQRPQNSE